MPPKVSELVARLEKAGFKNRRGKGSHRKGSHRNFFHPKASRPITISGKLGDDAKAYQERGVAKAIEEVQS